MQLFYNPDIDKASEQFSFDKEESGHIIKVLRKKEGDILFVTNGLGFLFKTEITWPSDKKCTVRIVEVKESEKPKYRLHLAVAPTKMNDRYEWFLEKATEIGLHEITPIICDHSERKIVKTERFDKIIQSAMKQSLHTFLPKLNEPMAFKDFVKTSFAAQKLIAHCEESQRKALKNTIKPNTDIVVLIGPEGDFSPNEITTAIENGYIAVTLGESRLRTETAAIVACHSVAFINEE